jgi:hypothetical protein
MDKRFLDRQFDRIGKSWKDIRSCRDVALHLWVPTISGVISFLLFGFVSQSIEIYRSLILEKYLIQVVWATFNVFWLSFLTWQSARLLARKFSCDYARKNSALDNVEIHSLLWLPRIIGILPLLGLLIGVSRSNSFSQLHNYFSIIWLIICLLSIFFLFCFFVFRRKISNYLRKLLLNQKQKNIFVQDSLFSEFSENLIINLALMWLALLTIPIVTVISGALSKGVIAVFIIFFLVNLTLYSWNPGERKRLIVIVSINFCIFILCTHLPPLLVCDTFGAVSIASLSISSMTVILSTVFNWGFDRQYKIPSVSLILVLALIFNLLNWNDNHQIRYLKDNISPELTYSSSLEDSFTHWLGSRKDLKDFQEKGLKEYPVYVVSAQGGGIYAAYHSATVLSKLHDTIPNFSDHVFAISSVSGGSIGASVYSALVKNSQTSSSPISVNASSDKTCQNLPICNQAHKIINKDFLSPLFALGLFPDMLQKFIPFSINDWDRSRGLEIGLEDSWETVVKSKKILSQPYNQFWKPSERSPALLLNTTTVETGERFVFSPFTIPYSSSKTMLDFKLDQSNIPLSTAAGLSARFPIISSTGWFTHEKEGKKYKNRLVGHLA